LSRPKKLAQRAWIVCANWGRWGDFCLFVYSGRKCRAGVVC